VPFDCRQTVAPTADPVTLQTAKSHLRVTYAADDDYISTLLAGAVQHAQRESGRQFCTATFALTLDDFPSYCDGGDSTIRLPVGPVAGVDSVVYRDADGVTQTLATSDYSVGVKTGRLIPATYWPATDPAALENVTVTFSAGYGGRADVPADAVAAILLLLADRWENRGDNVANFLADRPIPAGALRLLRNLGDGHQW
jgi:uncharacterized phiE125 gp8 family phage protein